MKHRIAIIGSGPAGLSAAIYTSRAEIETVIYGGDEPGGQLTKTTEIENYPGVMGKTGPELMMTMTEQAQKFGAVIEYETVTQLIKPLDHSTIAPLQLITNSGVEREYDAVILAMGAAPRLLGIGEDKYWGKGFSTCAVCDGAFYRGKKVYVVGGGDTAIEDAWALTKFASSVTMLVRGKEFRASRAMQKRVQDNPDKIKVLWETNLVGIEGERVETLIVSQSHGDTVTQQKLPAEGLFFAIGHVPATKWLAGSGVEIDEQGYIVLQGQSLKASWPTMTSKEGVFAGGDCVDSRYRQAAVAAGMGVAAALDAERWIESKEK